MICVRMFMVDLRQRQAAKRGWTQMSQLRIICVSRSSLIANRSSEKLLSCMWTQSLRNKGIVRFLFDRARFRAISCFLSVGWTNQLLPVTTYLVHALSIFSSSWQKKRSLFHKWSCQHSEGFLHAGYFLDLMWTTLYICKRESELKVPLTNDSVLSAASHDLPPVNWASGNSFSCREFKRNESKWPQMV